MTEFHEAAIALLSHLGKDHLQKQIVANASFAQTLNVKLGFLSLAMLDVYERGGFTVVSPTRVHDLADLPAVMLSSAAKEVLKLRGSQETSIAQVLHRMTLAKAHGETGEHETYAALLKILFSTGVEARITPDGFKLLGAYRKAMTTEQPHINITGNHNSAIVGNNNKVNITSQGIDVAQALQVLTHMRSLVEAHQGDDDKKELVRTDIANLQTELQRKEPVLKRINSVWMTLMETVQGFAALPQLQAAAKGLGVILGYGA